MLKPFFVWQNRALKRIDTAKVLCLVTEGNYTKVFLSDQSEYMVRLSLTAALKKLPPDIFIRIHESYVVSIYYIDLIEKDQLIIAGKSAPIGKPFYGPLIKKLNVVK